MAAGSREAYCSLLMSDAYLPGAMVLAHSLRDSGTKKQLAILVTLDSVAGSTIEELKKVYDHITPVDRIINKSPANLYLMNRPDLASTFTKIVLWRQTQFDHIVYIDADVVALRAPDELFNNPPRFSAIPDIGWPDCFNSGVLSLKPNMGDYYALLALAQRGISFDGADQGLLNMHFRNWERLSFTYNCTPSGNYQYVPAYRHFQSNISMVHFIGNQKPWNIGREQKGATGVYEELLGRWWAVYDKHYRIPTSTYTQDQAPRESKEVQQYVAGETSTRDYGFSEATHYTAEVRRYSADWDAMHQPPPAHSRPEAANFPTETYDMSADTKLFKAPEYPEPPKHMYYQVTPTPPAKEERPKPIFPWEATAPKPTRVFVEDLQPAPPPPVEPTPSMTTDEEETQTETMSPTTPPTIQYQRTNAWDEVPEIDRYVSNLPQNRRAKFQALLNNTSLAGIANRPSNPEAILSPSLEGPSSPSTSAEPQQRRPSMKLTDFPTEFERPSLPVTPAPVRRPSFWGAERDAQGDLPAAEGVPDQSDWDPVSKLAELQRRQSEVLGQGPGSPTRAIPDRQMVSGSMGDVDEAPLSEEQTVAQSNQNAVTTNANMPASFRTVDFAGGEQRGTGVEVMSPGS